MPRDTQPLKVFLIAGESSGDTLGAALMQGLKIQTGETVSFYGIGGPLMESEGLETIFPMRDLSVMGLLEVIPKLGKILKRIKQAVNSIEETDPDIVITIDSPDFNFRVIRSLRKRNKVSPAIIHYVAPTVWAWRPERAGKVADLYDGVLCLYPMEPAYFEGKDIQARFVGHPIASVCQNKEAAYDLKAEYGIGKDTKTLGLLFGSRMGELNRTGPILREAALQFIKEQENIQILALTLPHLAREVKYLLEGMPCKVHIVSEQTRKAACLSAMDIALATSGTVGLELAMYNVPHIIAYKMNPLTWALIKNRLTTKYAHLVNILLDKEIVPEFIQERCRPELILQHLNKACDDQAQKAGFEQARGKLQASGQQSPSCAAAKAILELVQSRSSMGT